MSTTKIEWTKGIDETPGKTWNPVTGCTKISEGCKNCYAERMAKRLAGRYGYDKDDPFMITIHWDRAAEFIPMKWKKPRKIFVCSMGDLFHDDVPFDIPHHVFQTASQLQHHTFIILTKRPQRMLDFSRWMAGDDDISINEWPRNCWIGVTAENQKRADERIPILLRIPAAVRFVSVEPMLGPIDISHKDIVKGYVDWVICGGESGPGARPMHPDWARSIRDQCSSAGVPFFFKQWGEWHPVGDYPKRDCAVDRSGRVVEPPIKELFPKGASSSDGWHYMYRIGKGAAGRELDGRTWDQYPAR